MNEQILLNVLVFLFGYVTCRTFYFVSALRKSVRIVQLGQIVGLFIIVRGLENLQWSRQYKLDLMHDNGASDHNMEAFKVRFEEELSFYKTKSIKDVKKVVGKFFEHTIEYDDWEGAMKFLNNNEDNLLNFIERD